MIKENIKNFFKENSEKYRIEMAFLYGSIIAGSLKEESDIDLAVYLSDNVSSEDEIFEIITEISAILSEEILREVNVIYIYPDFRHPMLYYNAIVHGTPLYIKNFNKYISLRNEAIFQMEDFSIFGIPWQLIIARKNLEVLEHG